MATKHHILLIGATGLCGRVFVEAALEAGHTLTLYVRNPVKLPADVNNNENVTVLQGELGDEEGLKRAAECGADVFVCLAGPTMGKKEGTPITDALKRLYPLLSMAGTVKRVMVLSTASYSAPQDSKNLMWWVGINVYVRGVGGDAYTEIKGIAETTVGLEEAFEWTVFRVPLLKGDKLGKNDGEVNTAWVGDKHRKDGFILDRGRLARWILKEIDEKKWVRLCPMLSNA